jgi:lipid-A-disaccharide synthase-like uncharacterized protein
VRFPARLVTVSSDSVIVGGVTGEWTLAELVRRAAQALADAEVRAPNGRVTQLPDARMIRWYATIGIVDKPSGFRGRTALYGHRHLLQLVAIKRLQAQGLPLAEIQWRLLGANVATLHGIAGLPESPAESTVDGASPEPRPRFWAARPAAPIEAPPAEATLAATATKSPQGTLHGVGLAGGAMLLVPATVHPDQVAAIRRAAQPLLEYLSTLGLLNPDEGAHA